MRLFSYKADGHESYAYLHDNFGIDIQKAHSSYSSTLGKSNEVNENIPPTLLEFLSDSIKSFVSFYKIREWIEMSIPKSGRKFREDGLIVDLDKIEFLPPVSKPGKVICIAGNFPAPNKLDKPEFPIIFLKPSSGLIGSGQSIILPPIAKFVTYEVELAMIIGMSSKNLNNEDPKTLIAGFTVANDLGDRVLEKRTTQWTSGKMFDTFTPIGPIVVTPDELSEIDRLSMMTIVNGEVVQKGSTGDMFFDIGSIIGEISLLTTLHPGDLILTGSPKLMNHEPQPEKYLVPGDVVECQIDRIGRLINHVSSER